MTSRLAEKLRVKSGSAVGWSLASSLWLKAGFVGVCMWFLFGGIWVDMARQWWRDPTWSQGMLLPPLALYLAWQQRRRTTAHPAIPDGRGLLLTAVACSVFLLGKLASEFFLMRLSSVILFAGLIWTFWGLPRLRTLVFPLVLLATMVPLPGLVYNSIAAPLQLAVSDLATRLAQDAGVAAFRDGNIIQLANLSLGVEDACSGISSLSALTVGSILLGYLLCSRSICRAALVAAAIPLALSVNIARVAGTAVLADYDPVLATGVYHSFSGWLIFVLGFSILYVLARMLHLVLELK